MLPCRRDRHENCVPFDPSTGCVYCRIRISPSGVVRVTASPILGVRGGVNGLLKKPGLNGEMLANRDCTNIRQRPSYAGAAVNVLEGLGGNLSVLHEGCDIPSQETPPRPGVLRSFAGRTTHSPIIHQPTNGLGTKWAARLSTLDANHDAEQPVDTSARNGMGRVRKTVSRRQGAHAAADGQMESGAKGEAQETVHTWDRPRAGHTLKHREEVH